MVRNSEKAKKIEKSRAATSLKETLSVCSVLHEGNRRHRYYFSVLQRLERDVWLDSSPWDKDNKW